MWGSKKPESQPVVTEQSKGTPRSTASSTWEGNKMSTDVNRTLSSSPSGSTARLGASLHVKGEISGNEDLHIDGSVEGLVQLEDRRLTVGPTAKLSADVVAREVVVYGNVKGNLRARDRIEIKKDGSVVGDLTTARIMIEDGAYFKGSIEIDKTAEKVADVDRQSYTRSAVASSVGPVVGKSTN